MFLKQLDLNGRYMIFIEYQTDLFIRANKFDVFKYRLNTRQRNGIAINVLLNEISLF